MFEIIKKIFRKKWETVYTTHNQDAYFKIKTKLSEDRIEHITKFDPSFGPTKRIYTILVRPEEAHKANDIIHKSIR